MQLPLCARTRMKYAIEIRYQKERAMVVQDCIPLQQLANGQTAEVAQLVGHADSVSRLGAIGIRAGANIQMVRSGRACIVRVGGSKLCLRPSQYVDVLVRPCPHDVTIMRP